MSTKINLPILGFDTFGYTQFLNGSQLIGLASQITEPHVSLYREHF